jgi:hypothetical protein
VGSTRPPKGLNDPGAHLIILPNSLCLQLSQSHYIIIYTMPGRENPLCQLLAEKIPSLVVSQWEAVENNFLRLPVPKVLEMCVSKLSAAGPDPAQRNPSNHIQIKIV